MKKIKNQKVFIGAIIVVALLIGGYFLFSGNGVVFDYGDNGRWVIDKINPDTGTIGVCEPRPDQNGFYQCCFNYEDQQVDCRDSNKLLGVTPLAIYKGTPGIGKVSHGFTIRNTGNVDFNAMLDSFTWTANPTSSVTFLNTHWNAIKGTSKSVAQGIQQSWSTTLIDIQTNCPLTPTTYTINATARATTTIEGVSYDSTSTKTTTFTCQKESISFDFDITF